MKEQTQIHPNNLIQADSGSVEQAKRITLTPLKGTPHSTVEVLKTITGELRDVLAEIDEMSSQRLQEVENRWEKIFQGSN